MINAIPGGMIGVIQEDAAVIADAYPLEYPLFSISGTNIFASNAASAQDEPEIPPMNVDKRQFVAPRPPVNLPVSISQKSIRFSDTPPYPITVPAVTKNGTASIVKLSELVKSEDTIVNIFTPSHINVK